MRQPPKNAPLSLGASSRRDFLKTPNLSKDGEIFELLGYDPKQNPISDKKKKNFLSQLEVIEIDYLLKFRLEGKGQVKPGEMQKTISKILSDGNKFHSLLAHLEQEDAHGINSTHCFNRRGEAYFAVTSTLRERGEVKNKQTEIISPALTKAQIGHLESLCYPGGSLGLVVLRITLSEFLAGAKRYSESLSTRKTKLGGNFKKPEKELRESLRFLFNEHKAPNTMSEDDFIEYIFVRIKISDKKIAKNR